MNDIVGEILHLETAPHDYPTREHDMLRTPFPRVEAIKMSFKYQFVSVWRGIPREIKASTSLKAFKRKVTEHFLNAY